jgi:chromosome segregation ATPase
MSLLDDYSENTNDGDQATADPVDTRRKRADLERQIVIAESDFKRISREIEDIGIQKRKLKKDEERIRIEKDDLDKKLNKLENDKRFFEEEITRLRKQIKTLP